MKSALAFLSAVLAVVALTQAAVPPEFLKKMDEYLETCTKKHGTNKGDVLKMLANYQLPETPEMKCTVDCYLALEGYLKEGKLDWEAVKVVHEQEYADDPESKEKANKVVDICKDQVNVDGKKECEFGEAALICVYKESKALGLEVPDYIKLAAA